MSQARRVLLIPNEPIGLDMAGPSIRFWEFAHGLSRYAEVTLAIPPLWNRHPAPNKNNLPSVPFQILFCDTLAVLKEQIRHAEVIVTVGANLSVYPFLAKTGKPLVVDMYIPSILEDIQRRLEQPSAEKNLHYAGFRGLHTKQLRTADFILCATKKQQDFWLGWLSAVGRVNPYTHRADPTLTRLIDLVPFGISDQPAQHTKPVLKGVHPAIGSNDKVILWGGGIWDWLDWRTAIKAMYALVDLAPDIKLVFLGVKTSQIASTAHNAAEQAIRLSKQLGLYNRNVIFKDWTPYHERHNYLLEADIGLNLHANHLETRFSFRTRMLDYIWTGLPIVTSAGDVMSDEVVRGQLGKVVQTGRVDQLLATLLTLLRTPNLREQYRPAFQQIQQGYRWQTVLRPLIQFCQDPYHAPDRAYLADIPVVETGHSTWYQLPSKVLQTVKQRGPRPLAAEARQYLRWKSKNVGFQPTTNNLPTHSGSSRKINLPPSPELVEGELADTSVRLSAHAEVSVNDFWEVLKVETASVPTSTSDNKRRIYLISSQAIGHNMAGPVAIRYWEFARVLAEQFEVRLIIPPMAAGRAEQIEKPTRPDDDLASTVELRVCENSQQLKTAIQGAEVLIVVGELLSVYPFLAETTVPLVVDLYVPFMVEGLQKYAHEPTVNRLARHAGYRGIHTQQLRTADFLLCASETLKDYWLGWLTALGRVNPYTYQHDPTLHKLLAIVPFGLPTKPPQPDKPAMKGIHSAIGPDDRVVLWGGGLWNWLDWETAIRAMRLVADQTPHVKLFFMGTKNPVVDEVAEQTGTPSHDAVSSAIHLSKQLGLFDQQVIFNDWVPYSERHNYLLEADVGISLHRAHLETRFSFRTRMLDYIWAGLPIIATVGDVMSAEVARWQLGQVVRSGDVEQVAQAILTMTDTPNHRQLYQPYFEQARQQYQWKQIMQPLIQFCEQADHAADKPFLDQLPLIETGQSTWHQLPQKLWHSATQYGWQQTVSETQNYINWKMRR
ncbi:glycosyltransferase [Anaerolineales bacterium HSG6]|nr:glycosyltransferase [Anaerolineales bacterium HSG6]